MLSKPFNALKGLFHVEIEISIESSDTFTFSAEFSLEMAKRITENEAALVWSDMWNCAIAVDDLEFSHVDTTGIAGYRIRGTNSLVWRNEIYPVEFVAVQS